MTHNPLPLACSCLLGVSPFPFCNSLPRCTGPTSTSPGSSIAIARTLSVIASRPASFFSSAQSFETSAVERLVCNVTAAGERLFAEIGGCLDAVSDACVRANLAAGRWLARANKRLDEQLEEPNASKKILEALRRQLELAASVGIDVDEDGGVLAETSCELSRRILEGLQETAMIRIRPAIVFGARVSHSDTLNGVARVQLGIDPAHSVIAPFILKRSVDDNSVSLRCVDELGGAVRCFCVEDVSVFSWTSHWLGGCRVQCS